MTRLFGVIGHPIAHSLSPAMHAAALRALRVDGLYTAFDVPPAFLRPVMRALTLAGVEGLNVTVPLKQAVVPLLDRVDPAAKAIGAVNTIVVRNRTTIGYNTDGAGFARALRDLGWRRRPVDAVILGAGGAARAVAWELSGIAGMCLTIANRHVERAAALARWLERTRPHVCVHYVPLSALNPVALESTELLVNTTTLGMRAGDAMPVQARALHRGMLVYDLIYHRPTELVREARRRGCVAATGASMLLYQGAESLRLWLKRPPPIGAMRQALQQALRSRAASAA